MNFIRNIAFVALAGLACASGSDLPVKEPQIRIGQLDAPRFLQERGGLVSVDYLVQIRNNAAIPITVDRIEIQTVAGAPYTVRPTPIEMNRVIGADEEDVLEISAWAYSYGGRAASIEPVTLRVSIRFESEKGSFQIVRVRRVEQP